MTFMQIMALWAAKRYLKVHHYRVKGYAGDTVYATGDVLLSLNAVRYFQAIDKAKTFEWEMQEVAFVQGCFKGIVPPVRRQKREEV